jgi:hypothetical protein
MHTFFRFRGSLVCWALRGVSACWTVWGYEGSGLAIEDGSPVWVNCWYGQCFTAVQEHACNDHDTADLKA